jgi:hypothetical protein
MDEKMIGNGRDTRTIGGGSGGTAADAGSIASLTLANQAVWDALRSPLRLQVLEAVRARPGVDARGLAEALGTRPPKLYYHLKILVAAGLLRELDGGDGDLAAGNGESTGGSNGSSARGSARWASRGSPRGPAATGYHATLDDHPEGFFDAHPEAAARSLKLTNGIAQAGIKAALSPKSARVASRSVSDFRNEALDAAEIEAIRGHIEAIRGILGAARARRRSRRELMRATAFVGVCIAELERAVLPDGPVGSNGR